MRSISCGGGGAVCVADMSPENPACVNEGKGGVNIFACVTNSLSQYSSQFADVNLTTSNSS